MTISIQVSMLRRTYATAADTDRRDACAINVAGLVAIMATGSLDTVAENPTAALFFWSPDGVRHKAAAEAVAGTAAIENDERVYGRCSATDDGKLRMPNVRQQMKKSERAVVFHSSIPLGIAVPQNCRAKNIRELLAHWQVEETCSKRSSEWRYQE